MATTKSVPRDNSNTRWEEWSGTGSGNAPTGLMYNTIGFDGDGLLYKYTSSTDTWTATIQTFDGFIGL